MPVANSAESAASQQKNADAELAVAAASKAASTALQAGSRAPLFTLADGAGHTVSLEHLLQRGPVVLHFFRGAWCTFGEDSLAEFAGAYHDVAKVGASAIAIAPPSRPPFPAPPLPMRELVDTDMKVAQAYGLAFDLPLGLRPRYRELGYLPPHAKSGEWLVPIPATYLLGSDGVVALAFVDVDYRNRFDHSSMLTALRALQVRQATRLSSGRSRLS